MTVTRPTLRICGFFFLLSSVWLVSSLATCCWDWLLACWAADWGELVAPAELRRADWEAPPLTDTFWPSTDAVTPLPPVTLAPPTPTIVPETVPPPETLAEPPARSVPLKLWAAFTLLFW